jgi:hypothetical protein
MRIFLNLALSLVFINTSYAAAYQIYSFIETKHTVTYKNETFELRIVPYSYSFVSGYLPGIYCEPYAWHYVYEVHLYPNGKYAVIHGGDMLKNEVLSIGLWKYKEDGVISFTEKSRNLNPIFGNLKHFYELNNSDYIYKIFVTNKNGSVGDTILTSEKSSAKHQDTNYKDNYLIKIADYHNWPSELEEIENQINQ